jgi:murein DD-endopeptidase MepM/ murein hydrolase activator NlpD
VTRTRAGYDVSRMRILAVLVLFVLLALGGAWAYAGRGGAPEIAFDKPEKYIGQTATLDLTVTAPGSTLTQLDVVFEQAGQRVPLFSQAQPATASLKQETPDRVRLTRAIGRREIPSLKSGEARIAVTATRATLFGLRHLTASASRTVQVRLEPPRVSVASMHQFVNLGGAEAVVYRASPVDVESGVRVGDDVYPGFPLSGAGVAADPSLHLAFFALLFDQDVNTPFIVLARDVAGNRATSPLDAKVFPKPFRRSRIEVTPQFLSRVVPAILENTPDFKVDDPNDLVQAFLKINRELRRKNAEQIAAYAQKTSAQLLWTGPFLQLGNSQVESLFADHRTYFYEGKEIDQQVHLGFDLAVTSAVPVVAANRGRVMHADYLGIYGNCVILDHGMGVQSLYAHLSSMDVMPGDMVDRGQTLGRSGMTGLAGGDHLHFTMLVNGHPVNAVEWWDAHWIEDRVTRKIREAVPGSAPAVPTATAGAAPTRR